MSERDSEFTTAAGSDRDGSRVRHGDQGGAAQDEAALLWPERSVTLTDGSVVVVDEMTFGQVNRLRHLWKPIADEAVAALSAVGEADQDDQLEAFSRVFDEHGNALFELVQHTARFQDGTQLDERTLDELPYDDGQTLVIAWLGVHLPFFGKRLVSSSALRAGIRDGMRQAMQQVSENPSGSSSSSAN